MALLVYYITHPEDGICLDDSDNLRIANLISRSVFMLAVAVQMIFNGGLPRLFISFLGLFRRIGRAFIKQEGEVKKGLDRHNVGEGVSMFILRKFYDRWALFLCVDIALWTQPEYEDFETIKIASIGMLACLLKAFALLGFIQDCCVIFSGKIYGKNIKDSEFHSGTAQFSEYWSQLWVGEILLLVAGLFFYGKMWEYSYDGSTIRPQATHYANLLLLGVNAALLILLIYFLRIIKVHEAEILSSSKILGIADDTVVGTYLKVSLLFESIKMLMFVQFCAILLDAIPIIEWAYPEFVPSPIVSTTMYLLGWSTPIFYNTFVNYFPLETKAIDARKYTILGVYLLAHISCSMAGAYRGCEKLKKFESDGWLEREDLRHALSFLLYLAKANAIPTSLGFGLLFVTSPTAARYSSSWGQLPLVMQGILAPLPWLSPHLLNELHIASGTVLFTGGVCHALSWMLIYSTKLLVKISVGVLFAAGTGLLMLTMMVKLLWPPGMKGLSYRYKWSYKRFDNFLKDSKYGSYHVYFANVTFLLYLAHGTVNLYPSRVYYWTFPLVCYLILYLLHPAKSTYFATLLQPFRSRETFDRKYTLLGKSCQSAKGRSLTDVRLQVQLPVYDHQFDEVIAHQPYTGYCDVILVKVRRPEARFSSEIETIHYYSVVNAVRIPNAAQPSIEVRLLIQYGGGMRKDGSSATLIKNDNATDTIEVSLPLPLSSLVSAHTIHV
jgi:hypothetical protein